MAGIEKINRFLMHLNDWALATAPNEWDDPEDKARRKAEYETIFECMRVAEKMLLKDAEPKGPITQNGGTKKLDLYARWKCPVCGGIYITVKGAYHFCPKCGQELAWNEKTCDTCIFHNKICDSTAYEGKVGYAIGGDWCELYMAEKGGGKRNEQRESDSHL